MRLQLMWPGARVISADFFNQMMTMHGTTMIFFVAMPILAGVANYIVPLQIGARDMAFPRLNALGLWVTLFGGILAYFSFATGGAPAIGWFAYAPLTEHAFARGSATDFWILGLLVSGIGSLSGAINLVTTVLAMRCPGMTLRKIPLYTWMAFWANVQILFAIPPLTAALVMLWFDRKLGAHFFDAQAGGSPYLWQHLFWFFGHPEVYILVLPAFGMVSDVIPVFSRQGDLRIRIRGRFDRGHRLYQFWRLGPSYVHSGMSRTVDVYFAAASLVVGIPTGVKMFNWLATIYGGRLRMAAPMLFCFGFLSMFVIGGLTGIMLAVAPIDYQLSDSYFVVGHFHWVIIGGILMGLFAGLYYWYPKVTGRMYSERLARWQFWLLLIGFILTFGPMHIAGIVGMPRRIFTYQADRGLAALERAPGIGCLDSGAELPDFRMELPDFALVWRSLAATTRGTPGPSNGPRPRLRRFTTSRRFLRCAAAGRSGI